MTPTLMKARRFQRTDGTLAFKDNLGVNGQRDPCLQDRLRGPHDILRLVTATPPGVAHEPEAYGD